MVNWQALLLIYTEINVRFGGHWFSRHTFKSQLTAREISDALESFAHFPALAHECSQGEVCITTTIAHSPHPLTSLTEMGDGLYWPSPTDTKRDLDEFAPPGSFDSVFVLWPQNNPLTGAFVPSGGWGLGMGASDWSNGATYATIANAPTEARRSLVARMVARRVPSLRPTRVRNARRRCGRRRTTWLFTIG